MGIVSKDDGPGQLILTQKRLYFLPEARSSVRLLTELMNIKAVEKYQHQTVFSSSKPGIKIHVSSSPIDSVVAQEPTLTLKAKSSSLGKEGKPPVSLLLKNSQEQELWYTIIFELWSGWTIAHEQCDTSVLNTASRHIALMDTLAHINYTGNFIGADGKRSNGAPQRATQRYNEVRTTHLNIPAVLS